MDVFLTIDAEVWPAVDGWPAHRRLDPIKDDLDARIATDLYGVTSKGDYGIGYQVRTFNAYGLKATFFLEALAWGVLGTTELGRAVATIQGGGHDIQLHLHTEWLSDLHSSGLPPAYRQFMHQFSREEQIDLIAYGRRALVTSGAAPVCAFRAGSYGANMDTLAALSSNGMTADSSHNSCSPAGHCLLLSERALLHPRILQGVTEYPVAVFEDIPGHLRPAQLCACSLDELTNALESAWRAGWQSFVIVLHSFELVRRASPGEKLARPHWLNIRRFQGLCEFLANHPDRYRCTGFAETMQTHYPMSAAAAIPRTGVARAAWRQLEQVVSWVF